MSKKSRNLPAVAHKIPVSAKDGISGLADELGLDWDRAAFLALRRCGVTRKAAYKYVRPHVEDGSAATLGSRWDRELREIAERVPFNAAQAVLADWVAVSAMVDGGASWRDRLTASDQTNRKLGRYNADSPPEGPSPWDRLEALAAKFRPPEDAQAPADGAGHVEAEEEDDGQEEEGEPVGA